jgi:beta-1,4-N-acetylglucosaminyltransferase
MTAPPPELRAGPILLVASSGGHLMQLATLREAIPAAARHWVTFAAPDSESLLSGEAVTFAYSPTNRHALNLARNLGLAVSTIRRLRPRAVISTGAGVAVPFLLAGRLLGAHTVYIESMARIEEPSLTGRLVHPFVHDFFVQWPQLVKSYRRATYEGSLIDLP